MKIQLIPTLFTIAALTISAHADVFVMKNGTKVEGTLLREEGDTYVVEVYVTKTIKDQKRIAKADVASVQKDRPDEKAFEEVKSLVPTPDLLPPEEYKQRISLLEIFIKQYPDTSLAAKAKGMISTLKSELDTITAGGMKVDGKLLTPAEYRANAYEIDARVLEAKIRSAAERNDYPGALEPFVTLQNDFDASATYKEVAPYVRKVMETYRTKVSQLAASVDARAAQQKKGLASMNSADRANSERAIADEMTRSQKLFQREKAMKKTWVTPSINNKSVLQDIVRTADKELATIDRKSKALKIDAGDAYRKAWDLIQKTDSDPKEVKAAVSTVRGARIPDRYIKYLEEAAKQHNYDV
ncbi:hypothetical protein JIN85_04865 [Luteolibacter pohnpeiensis]|uniref:DUF3826 domain-containing protein n=1 Tax=Luteolibacter pohnpeiensis TaxID=454153 RepID=A0A934SAE2_9BACT|nr:PTPDL family protein [Luteolibacter pohnpeiensis]MBK1881733.1 hypothetical protein [Luteolibacter pohnpeiensis]